MAEDSSGSVTISTTLQGAFEGLSLRESAAVRLVKGHKAGEAWDKPILLYGADVEADIEAIMQVGGPWLHVRNFRDLVGQRRSQFEIMEGRLDHRFYENLVGDASRRLGSMLRGTLPFSDLVEFVTRGPSGQGILSRSNEGADLTDWVERLCNTRPLILPWQTKHSFLSAFVLAVWTRHPRLWPIVLYYSKRFGVPSGEGLEVTTSGISFEALALEAERVFGMSSADIEKAYRVWQLSRTGDTTKPQATTPKTVSLQVARDFLNVASRARTDKQANFVAGQKPAPLIFELDHGGVGIKQEACARDNKSIVAAGAASLERRIENLQHDATLSNIVPSAKGIFDIARRILERIQADQYGDGDVVTLGLELNALQWHVNSVQDHLAEVSLGELTGLFATSQLFLARFPVWLDYSGVSPANGRQEDGVATFELSRQLLVAAHERPAFLTGEANERIGAVLERNPAEQDAPALREGVVRSGENLAAITAEGFSRVAIDEAKALGSKTKDKAYEEASSAIVSFVTKNAPLLLKIGEARDWPWLSWLKHLIQP